MIPLTPEYQVIFPGQSEIDLTDSETPHSYGDNLMHYK